MIDELPGPIPEKERVHVTVVPDPKGILIVVEDPTARHALSSALARLGYDVMAVSEGTQILEVLDTGKAMQIAIADFAVLEENGLKVCREIRKRYGPNIYIILLTQPDFAECAMTNFESVVDDFLLKPFAEAELRSRLRLGLRVLDMMASHVETQRLLLHAATCDELTDLWNRRMILHQLSCELNRTRHERHSLAVAMVDIDLFKTVNDTFGHAAGDFALRDIAASLRSQLRSYDFIGRYGGEEFLILLPGCDRKEGADIARRICQTIASKPIRIGELKVPVTVSIGLASTSDVGFDSATLIATADQALYQAKENGRNRVFTNGPNALRFRRSASKSRPKTDQ
jgi:two-component system, cell cycle response regulator